MNPGFCIDNTWGVAVSNNRLFSAGLFERGAGMSIPSLGLEDVSPLAVSRACWQEVNAASQVRDAGDVRSPAVTMFLLRSCVMVLLIVGLLPAGEVGYPVSWGDRILPPYDLESPANPVIRVAAGFEHTVVLKNNGTVVAWGHNYYGQATPPSGLGGVTAIAARGFFTLALKNDGTVVAWGDNSQGQSTVPSGLSGVTAIAAGSHFSLALKNNGTVVAWGNNAYGQTTTTGLSGVTAIAAGDNHAVGLKNDGTVVVWGSNYQSQLTVPGGLNGVAAIAAGGNHSLALKNDGTVVAWGENWNGEATVPGGLSGVTAIAAGFAFSVALKSDGTVVAWGGAHQGRTAVPIGLSGVTAIAAGNHTVALKNDGTVVAWGWNTRGQTCVPSMLSGITAIASRRHTMALKNNGTVVAIAGDNTYGETTVPIGLSGVTAVKTGDSHTVVLKNDGTVVAWGSNSDGQSTVPSGLNAVVAIAAGPLHCLALKDNGTVVGWGRNLAGQATPPSGLNGVTAIAAGVYHSLALKNDGTVVAWGDGSIVPSGLNEVIAIAAGSDHSVALKSNGTVVAWGGANIYGQTTVPSGLSGVTAIAASEVYTMALKNDGTVVVWGGNYVGIPSVPSGLSGMVAIAAGNYHIAALKRLLPTVTIAATDPNASEVGPNTGTFTVTRTGSTASALTVSYSRSGTASASDYATLSGSVQILAGNTSATITVTPIADSLAEGNETVIASITANAALYAIGSPATATVTIADATVALPTVSILATDPTASEVGPNTGTFTVTRTGSTASALTVAYSRAGTATSSDYSALGGSVQILADNASATITVTPIADSLIEGNETVIATIVGSPSYTIGSPSSATITISDSVGPTVTLAAQDPSASEVAADPGALVFTRTGGTTEDLSISYAIGGTAVTADYQALTGKVIILKGNATATVPVVPVQDILIEGSESVVATITDSAVYVIGTPSSATITISDGPSVPTVSVAATDAIASEIAPNPGVFTITRTGVTTVALTVGYSISGTSSPTDYAPVTGSVQIPAGQASASVTITPVADTIIEGKETAALVIIPNASLYAIGGTGSATVTIDDSYAARINFQPTASVVPSGYLVDDGAVYGARSGSLTYGWNLAHGDVTRDRGIASDQRLDTLCHFHANANWQLAVPNGSYSVFVSIGDAANASVHTLNVEGLNYWNALSLGANVFANKTQTVTVSDGKLTLDQGSAVDKATRINYIEVKANSITLSREPAYVVVSSSAGTTSGTAQQFTATAYNLSGQVITPAPTFTWSENGPGSISASGLYQASVGAGGPYTISATTGGVVGNASVYQTGTRLISISGAQATVAGQSFAQTITISGQAGNTTLTVRNGSLLAGGSTITQASASSAQYTLVPTGTSQVYLEVGGNPANPPVPVLKVQASLPTGGIREPGIPNGISTGLYSGLVLIVGNTTGVPVSISAVTTGPSGGTIKIVGRSVFTTVGLLSYEATAQSDFGEKSLFIATIPGGAKVGQGIPFSICNHIVQIDYANPQKLSNATIMGGKWGFTGTKDGVDKFGEPEKIEIRPVFPRPGLYEEYTPLNPGSPFAAGTPWISNKTDYRFYSKNDSFEEVTLIRNLVLTKPSGKAWTSKGWIEKCSRCGGKDFCAMNSGFLQTVESVSGATSGAADFTTQQAPKLVSIGKYLFLSGHLSAVTVSPACTPLATDNY